MAHQIHANFLPGFLYYWSLVSLPMYVLHHNFSKKCFPIPMLRQSLAHKGTMTLSALPHGNTVLFLRLLFSRISQHFRGVGTVLALAWRDWGKPWEILFSIARDYKLLCTLCSLIKTFPGMLFWHTPTQNEQYVISLENVSLTGRRLSS
jgi:hypothetical protein